MINSGNAFDSPSEKNINIISSMRQRQNQRNLQLLDSD